MGHGDASTFAQVALRHGVEVVPGETMAPDGGHRDRMRIPYCFDPPILTEMIDRLARAWDSYTASTHRPREESLSVVV
jgi:DNA-binding transcriptional MocR family regulator